MAFSLEFAEPRTVNPLDMVEDFADAHEWVSDRSSEDEITIGISGKWCDFHLWVSWRAELGSLHFACIYDLKVPTEQQRSLHGLLALANERMTLGHFDIWRDEELILFRHTQLMGREGAAYPEQIETIFDIAFTECERFFPAIQYVLWGGKSAEDAAAAAMMDCVGEA